MDETTLRRIVREESKAAAEELLQAHGLDTRHPLEQQADQRFLRNVRRGAESGAVKAIAMTVIAIILGGLSLVGIAAKTRFGP